MFTHFGRRVSRVPRLRGNQCRRLVTVSGAGIVVFNRATVLRSLGYKLAIPLGSVSYRFLPQKAEWKSA